MNKYSKPNFTEADLGKNPFAEQLVIKVFKKEFKGQFRHDEEVIIPVHQEVEYNEFCKLYSDSHRRLCVSKLNVRAKELLIWIMYTLESGKDYLWINKRRYMLENGVKSINTYNSAITELAKEGLLILTARKNDIYWINPHYLFSGNRLTKYPKKILEV